MPTSTAKQDALELIARLPEDSSTEEILRELAFSRVVERGLEDSREGRIIPHSEVAARIESWAK